MIEIKKKVFYVLFKKANFSLWWQIILHFSNKDFWTIWCQANPQRHTALLLAPFVREVKLDRYTLSLYICITMQQQFFPITHSMHPLQPINIPSDYRFSFCFRNLSKAAHDTIVWAPPFCWGGLKHLPNFQQQQKKEGGRGVVTGSYFL